MGVQKADRYYSLLNPPTGVSILKDCTVIGTACNIVGRIDGLNANSFNLYIDSTPGVGTCPAPGPSGYNCVYEKHGSDLEIMCDVLGYDYFERAGEV